MNTVFPGPRNATQRLCSEDVSSMFKRYLELLPRLRAYRPGDENRVAAPDTEAAEWLLDWLAYAERYHQYSLVGFHHIPRRGAALLVGFHSFYVMDTFLLSRRVFLRDRRVPRGLTDKIAFSVPGLRDFFATIGIVAGTQENGLALFANGELACCMPGGGMEWSRSSALKRRRRWGDHHGYARLAIRASVPVIPTACPASDDAYYLPVDGWSIGKVLRGAFNAPRNLPLPPFAFGLGPAPLPVRLTQYVGEPIFPEVPPEAADDPEQVFRFDGRVRQAIDELLKLP